MFFYRVPWLWILVATHGTSTSLRDSSTTTSTHNAIASYILKGIGSVGGPNVTAVSGNVTSTSGNASGIAVGKETPSVSQPSGLLSGNVSETVSSDATTKDHPVITSSVGEVTATHSGNASASTSTSIGSLNSSSLATNLTTSATQTDTAGWEECQASQVAYSDASARGLLTSTPVSTFSPASTTVWTVTSTISFATVSEPYTTISGYPHVKGTYTVTSTQLSISLRTEVVAYGVSYTTSVPNVASPTCTIPTSQCSVMWQSYFQSLGLPTTDIANAKEPQITPVPSNRPRCSVGDVSWSCATVTQTDGGGIPFLFLADGSPVVNSASCALLSLDVKLLYWPTTATAADTAISQPATAVFDTHTLTSPTVYLTMSSILGAFTTELDISCTPTYVPLGASTTQSNSATIITQTSTIQNIFMGLNPEDVSSVVLFPPSGTATPDYVSSLAHSGYPSTYNAPLVPSVISGAFVYDVTPVTRAVNYSDISQPPPDAYFANPAPSYVFSGQPLGGYIFDDLYAPQLVPNAAILSAMPTEFSSCNWPGIYLNDPPTALTPELTIGVPTLPPSGLITGAPSVHETPFVISPSPGDPISLTQPTPTAAVSEAAAILTTPPKAQPSPSDQSLASPVAETAAPPAPSPFTSQPAAIITLGSKTFTAVLLSPDPTHTNDAAAPTDAPNPRPGTGTVASPGPEPVGHSIASPADSPIVSPLNSAVNPPANSPNNSPVDSPVNTVVDPSVDTPGTVPTNGPIASLILNPTPQRPAPGTPSSGTPSPEDPSSGNPSPEDPLPEDPSPEDPSPEDPSPKNPSSPNPAPENPWPQNPPSQDPSAVGTGPAVTQGPLRFQTSPPRVVSIGSATLTVGGPATTINGVEVSAGPQGIVVGGSETVSFSSQRPVPQSATLHFSGASETASVGSVGSILSGSVATGSTPGVSSGSLTTGAVSASAQSSGAQTTQTGTPVSAAGAGQAEGAKTGSSTKKSGAEVGRGGVDWVAEILLGVVGLLIQRALG